MNATISKEISASAPISQQISASIRRLDGTTLKRAKLIAKRENITVDSLIWLFNDVFDSGHVRSAAYRDCPSCVIQDGLVTEALGRGLNFTPWQFTDKARSIVRPEPTSTQPTAAPVK